MFTTRRMVLRSHKQAPQLNVASPPAKRKRSQKYNAMQITDVYTDCLEHIFGYLELNDLNNVAEAHSHFLPAARLVYKRIHGAKTVKIRNSSHDLSVGTESETPSNIVNATTTSFIQNFGPLIEKMELDYFIQPGKEDRHHWREAERAIFRHCTKTLTDIMLVNCRGKVFEEIREPFKNIKSVSIYDSFVDSVTVEFDQWFPNASKLELCLPPNRIPQYFKGRFRSLEEINLVILNHAHMYPYSIAGFIYIRNFFRLNNQIKYLHVDSNFEDWASGQLEFLQFISRTLPQLKKLSLMHFKMNRVDVSKRIHFKNLTTFELQSTGYYPENVSISFDNKLKSLKLYTVSSTDPKWVHFITKNSSIAYLSYFPTVHYHQQTANQLLDIVKKLPNLMTINIQAHAISPKNLQQFLEEYHQIASIKLTTIQLKFFAGFKDDLNDYVAAIDTRYFQTELTSKGSVQIIIIRRIPKA